jgi:uncharacterized membrane protein YjgN (DUF898 family)
MTTLDAPIPSVQPGAVALPPRQVRFLGREGDFWKLMIRGSALLAVTLGIYRFWLTTDTRRFLWSNTEVLGQPLEYTGTARELLIGFLIALAILVPLNALLFGLALYYEVIGEWFGVFAFVVLTVLGHYAFYRARRYRLTRTVYRGIRFHQTGSAWHYALCASLWSVIIVITLGLAYPFMESRLERLKMRNTYLGNLQGRFEGKAFGLFLRGFLMWLIVIGPFVGALIAAAAVFDPNMLSELSEDGLEQMFAGSPELTIALSLVGSGFAWIFLAGMLLFPIFVTMVMRWWVSGLRFGELTVKSQLRATQVYGVYLRFIGWSMVLGIIASIVIGAGLLVIGFVLSKGDVPQSGEIAATVLGVILYIVLALAYSALYQVKVTLGLWRRVVESLELTNPSVLDHVTSVGAPASPVGEGLADALNVGSF